MPYDPSRLLRQKWDSPDDLARELYVMFTNERQPSSLTLAQSSTEPTKVPTTLELPVGEQIQGRLEVARQTTSRAPALPLAPTRPSSVQPSRQDTHRVTPSTLPQPAEGSESVSLADSTTHSTPPAVDLAHLASRIASTYTRQNTNPSVGSPRGGDEVPPTTVVQDLASSGAPKQKPLVPPVAATTQSVPVISPPLRQVAINPPPPPKIQPTVASVLPTTLPQRIALATATRARHRKADPDRVGEDYTPKPFDLGVSMSTDVGTTTQDQSTPENPHSEIELDPTTLFFGQITPAGIPGAKPASSGNKLPLVAGAGQAYVMDIDGNQFTAHDMDPVAVFNPSPLPQGGGQITPLRLWGEYFFLADPPKFASGKVAQSIGSGSPGNPGMGKVQCYYTKSSASVPSSGSVAVTSTYKVTAQVGTSCSIMVKGGSLTLAVLDCQ